MLHWFPFKSPDANIFDATTELAQNFINIVNQLAISYSIEDRLFCGIGICYGSLIGNFTQSGIIEYHVYGDAIVRAHRYEGMRKVLFPSVTNSHFLIISERVYHRLSPEKADSFEYYSL